MTYRFARRVPHWRAPEPPGALVLLGHPVAHSRSPIFQNAALRSIGSPLTYEALDVPPPQLRQTLEALGRVRGAGNVTIPHKEAVHAACARRSPVAERVGAVNTFWTEDGALVGDNTDVEGIVESLTLLLGPPSAARFEVRLLGAGGSAAAALVALEQWTGARVSLWSRSPERAAALVARVRPEAVCVSAPDEGIDQLRLVINATPLGLAGEAPPLAPDRLPRQAALLDLVYAPGETPWIRAGRAAGLRALDGLRLLVEQGARSFARWYGREPDRSVLWRALGTPPPVPRAPPR